MSPSSVTTVSNSVEVGRFCTPPLGHDLTHLTHTWPSGDSSNIPNICGQNGICRSCTCSPTDRYSCNKLLTPDFGYDEPPPLLALHRLPPLPVGLGWIVWARLGVVTVCQTPRTHCVSFCLACKTEAEQRCIQPRPTQIL